MGKKYDTGMDSNPRCAHGAKIKRAEHMVIKGSIHCYDYDEDIFPCVHN